MATCFGVDEETLAATFISDGGEAFAALLGIGWQQMMDLTLELSHLAPGEVDMMVFGF